MAVSHGFGKIVTDGLVLALDAADINSFPQKQNYLRATEDFTNTSIWTPLNFSAVITRTANDAVAPNGTQTADKLVKSSGNGIRQSSNIFAGTTGDTTTFEVWAKTDTTANISLDISDEGGTPFDLTSTWRLCKITHTHTGRYGSTVSFVDISLPTDTPVYLWGARWYSGGEQKPYYPVATSNTTVKNLVGSNGGTLVNGTLYENTNRGTFAFDGSNDRISLSNNYTLSSTSDWTLQTWVQSNQTSPQSPYLRLLNSGIAGGSNYFYFEWNNRILATNSTGGSFAFQTGWSPGLPLDNSMFLLTLAGKSSSLEVYVNSTKTTVNATLSGDLIFNSIMNANNNYSPESSISTFSIYNRALTAQEVLQNYNALKGRFGL